MVHVEARLKDTGELIGKTDWHNENDPLTVIFTRDVHSDEGNVQLVFRDVGPAFRPPFTGYNIHETHMRGFFE